MLLEKWLHERQDKPEQIIGGGYPSLSLQLILWSLWTLAVVVTACLNWHTDVAAQRPLNLLGLVIHTALVGIIGLLVMTVIELHLEPWRFID